MQSNAKTPQEYIGSLPPDRKKMISDIRKTIVKNLPPGFEEVMSYGMIGWVVPHSLYPKGYHANPKLPLGLINLASQKNYISLHHMGLYEGPLLDWFKKEWQKGYKNKLDMGKCCIRFKKYEEIPFNLIGELATRLTPERWIGIYEKMLSRRTRR
jgi:hypothetical protein